MPFWFEEEVFGWVGGGSLLAQGCLDGDKSSCVVRTVHSIRLYNMNFGVFLLREDVIDVAGVPTVVESIRLTLNETLYIL